MRVPFEPEGSTRFVRNAVPRGTGPIPLDAVAKTARQSEHDFGRESLTNLERWIREGYDLEAYAIHQGGFDYYFAHVEGTERWADASAALFAMDREQAAGLMRDAVELFLGFDHDNPDQAAVQSYLEKMRAIDRQFEQAMPDLQEQLAAFADRHYPYSDRA